MLTTISGTYENGHVFLEEIPQVNHKIKVFVTFMEEIPVKVKPKQERLLGTMKGSFKLSSDFNEPLDDLKDYM